MLLSSSPNVPSGASDAVPDSSTKLAKSSPPRSGGAASSDRSLVAASILSLGAGNDGSASFLGSLAAASYQARPSSSRRSAAWRSLRAYCASRALASACRCRALACSSARFALRWFRRSIANLRRASLSCRRRRASACGSSEPRSGRRGGSRLRPAPPPTVKTEPNCTVHSGGARASGARAGPAVRPFRLDCGFPAVRLPPSGAPPPSPFCAPLDVGEAVWNFPRTMAHRWPPPVLVRASLLLSAVVERRLWDGSGICRWGGGPCSESPAGAAAILGAGVAVPASVSGAPPAPGTVAAAGRALSPSTRARTRCLARRATSSASIASSCLDAYFRSCPLSPAPCSFRISSWSSGRPARSVLSSIMASWSKRSSGKLDMSAGAPAAVIAQERGVRLCRAPAAAVAGFAAAAAAAATGGEGAARKCSSPADAGRSKRPLMVSCFSRDSVGAILPFSRLP